MKKLFTLAFLMVIMVITGSEAANLSGHMVEVFSKHSNLSVQNTHSEKVTLIFTIRGMKSGEDALAIDQYLKERSFIYSSVTDFSTGQCKVETEDIKYKDTIIEIIYHIEKSRGEKVTVEFVNSSSGR